MRRLAWFSGGFGAVCLLCCLAAAPLWAGIGSALLLLLALTLRVLCRRGKGPHLKAGRCALFLALGALAAAGWFALYSALFFAPAEAMAGTRSPVSATVLSYPEESSVGGYSVLIGLDGGITAPDVLVFAGADWGALTPGEHISSTLRLEKATRIRGDETTYYTAKGVFLLGYCEEPPVLHPEVPLSLRALPARCARALRSGIFTAFDSAAAPLAAAVTLGDKSVLSPSLAATLTRAGILHAVVVSGLHLSLLSAAIVFLCAGSRRAALLLIPLLLFYALMAGASPSALRAVAMQGVLLLGGVIRRKYDPPSSLALALLLLLLQNPYAAASVSLQLSFASVSGILLAGIPIYRTLWALPQKVLRGRGLLRALWRFLSSTLAVSLGAALFTTPLIALYFRQVTLIASLTNLLTLWPITVLLVSALLLGLLAIPLPALAIPLGRLFGLTAHYLIWVVGRLGTWRFASLDVQQPFMSLWLVTAYLLILLLVCSRRKWRQALISVPALALLLLCCILFNSLSVRRAQLTLTALDVGQGASTLFLSGGQSMLVDCGGSASRSAGDIAADRLTAIGRSALDVLVFTHLDSDHFNGAEQLFARLRIARVYLPILSTQEEQTGRLLAMAEREGAEVIFVTDTLHLSLGSAAVTLFPPMGSGTSNEEGLFVLTSCGEFDALITGDADAFVESLLTAHCPLPDIELLMVGHHGSAGSTSQLLLDATRPELAFISVGYNTYGHPAPEVLRRLADCGAEVRRTDLSGPLTLSLREGQVSLRPSSP